MRVYPFMLDPAQASNKKACCPEGFFYYFSNIFLEGLRVETWNLTENILLQRTASGCFIEINCLILYRPRDDVLESFYLVYMYK